MESIHPIQYSCIVSKTLTITPRPLTLKALRSCAIGKWHGIYNTIWTVKLVFYRKVTSYSTSWRRLPLNFIDTVEFNFNCPCKRQHSLPLGLSDCHIYFSQLQPRKLDTIVDEHTSMECCAFSVGQLHVVLLGFGDCIQHVLCYCKLL